jgi:Flp pilus assembly protein TadD
MDMNKSIRSAFEHYQSGNLEQAENICWEILKAERDDGEASHFWGLIFYRRGNSDLALKNIRKAISLDLELIREKNFA